MSIVKSTTDSASPIAPEEPFSSPGNKLDDTIYFTAKKNVTPMWTRIINSPVFPALLAAILTFIILVMVKPQFVQREHSSAIALPKLNYGLIFLLSGIVFIVVLAVPYFIKI